MFKNLLTDKAKNISPQEIVEALNKHIVGQDNAKRAVAIALRNRVRRTLVKEELRNEITPKNILMIGPTGVGKTEIARRLAKLANAPFIKVEATKFTEVGFVGRDVESIVRDLLEVSINLTHQRTLDRFRSKANAAAEKRLLDVLLPKPKNFEDDDDEEEEDNLNTNFDDFTSTGDEENKDLEDAQKNKKKKYKDKKDEIVYSTEDEDELAIDESSLKLNDSKTKLKKQKKIDKDKLAISDKTRELFRKKLRSGELDDKEVEIEIAHTSIGIEIMAPPGMEEMTNQLQNLFQSISSGGKKHLKKLKVKDAMRILRDEEAAKFINEDEMKLQAIEAVEQHGIVFLDEIDKVTQRSERGSSGADVSREGVQRDLLPLIEGSTVSTKYGMVKTDHILFIASGAFHYSKPSDLIPELQGRLPIRVELDALKPEDFVKILTEPDASLTEQYQALLETEGVKLKFRKDGINRIAQIAWEVNEKTENIGARRLHTVIERLLEDISYRATDYKNKSFIINAKYVDEQLADLSKNEDLSRFIL